jgi:tetratricopeptide (TPR) repeat protein
MRRAYEAFGRGELADAERILTIVVEQFPDSAEGHNNLGFIQLAGGNPEAALRSFLRAEEIGFSPAQILRANIGCCRFLLGDSNSALDTFSSLVGSSFAARGSVLVALGRDKFQIVPLSSPTDFVVLMALNAARCALALGRISEAQTFVNVSMAGDFSLNAAAQSTFARLRAELIEDLRVASEPRPHQ